MHSIHEQAVTPIPSTGSAAPAPVQGTASDETVAKMVSVKARSRVSFAANLEKNVDRPEHAEYKDGRSVFERMESVDM